MPKTFYVCFVTAIARYNFVILDNNFTISVSINYFDLILEKADFPICIFVAQKYLVVSNRRA